MRYQLWLFAALALLVGGLHAAASDESFPSCTVSSFHLKACESAAHYLKDCMRQTIILGLLLEHKHNMLL